MRRAKDTKSQGYKGRVWCSALLKESLKVLLQSSLPIQICDMEQIGALLHLKSLLQQAPCLVKKMRKISLIRAEGKHHSPILGICFSHVVYKEQCLFSDDECLWHKSLAAESSLIQKVKDTELSSQLLSSSTECNVLCMKLRGSCTLGLASLAQACGLNPAWSFHFSLSLWHLGVFPSSLCSITGSPGGWECPSQDIP